MHKARPPHWHRLRLQLREESSPLFIREIPRFERSEPSVKSRQTDEFYLDSKDVVGAVPVDLGHEGDDVFGVDPHARGARGSVPVRESYEARHTAHCGGPTVQ
jgi:hypothetical protein